MITTMISDYDSNDLRRRALAAYYRAETREPGIVPTQPVGNGDVVELEGRRYVVLNHTEGVLAVYRVRNDGQLRKMRRPPKEIGM